MLSLIIIILLAVIAVASVIKGKLTPAGGLTGFAVAVVIYLGAGVTGALLLSAFFALGILASKWHSKDKHIGSVQDSAEARTPGQVWANAGVAALSALLTLLLPSHALLFHLMLAGSLASATADTLASELGVVYSKRFYNCLTLKPDIKGLDGVISVEGLLLGAAGAAILGAITVIGYRLPFTNVIILTLAGCIGNYADSVLGATLERKGTLGNNQVNFMSTLIAAFSVALLLLLF